jgi:hypothetical protein
MESFLRSNPGVRWAIIIVLLTSIFVEGLLIRNRLITAPASAGNGAVVDGGTGEPVEGGGGDVPPSVAAVELSCTVVEFVNLRGGPSVNSAVLTVLDEGITVTALARNGDVPWLFVEVDENQQGWASSIDPNQNPLVQCDGDLQTLPEREG